MKFSILLLLLVAPLPTLADSKTPDFNNPSEMARHYENRIAEREREQKEELRQYHEREQLDKIERKLDDLREKEER